MKRIIMILYLLFFCLGTNYSQIITEYGLKLGTVISYPTWTKSSKKDTKVKTMTGYDFGGFISIKIFKSISLVPELHFLQKGFKYPIEKASLWEPNGTGEYYTIKSSANYLSFSINTSWSFYKSTFQSYIYGGARFDFIVDKNGDYWKYYYDRYKDNDFGYNIGIGLQTKEILGIGTGIEFKYSPNTTDSYADGFEQIKNKSYEILLVIYN